MEQQPMEDNILTLYDDEGNEIEMLVLAFKEHEDVTYALVTDNEEDEDTPAEVMHFKLTDDGENDTICELIDEEHQEFDMVFELFRDAYEALEIDIQDFDL